MTGPKKHALIENFKTPRAFLMHFYVTNFQKYTILLIALGKQKPGSSVLISVIFRIMWLKLSQNFRFSAICHLKMQ